MSAEGKSKHGAAGLSKAQHVPFRINGRSPNWAARKAGAYQVRAQSHGGSTTVRGVLGGYLAAAVLGTPIDPSARLVSAFEAGLDRCTVLKKELQA